VAHILHRLFGEAAEARLRRLVLRLEKQKATALLVLAIVASITLPPVLTALIAAEPGLYLELRFSKPSERGYLDETDLLKASRDVVFCARLEAVVPPPRDLELLFFKCFKGATTIHVPYRVLERVAGEWFSLLRERKVPEGVTHEHIFGLLMRVLVINTTSNEVLYDVIDSIPLRVGDFAKPLAVKYIVFARKGVYQVDYKKIGTYLVKTESAVVADTGLELAYRNAIEPYGSEWRCSGYQYAICYELVARVTPEDMQSYLPPDYFRLENNRLYMKTPILIVENPYYYSGVVSASISIVFTDAKLQLRFVFAPGEIINKLMNAEYPSVNFQLGGPTWGGTSYYYYDALILQPEEAGWLYVWARPIQEYLRVYYCSFNACSYVGDEVRSLVTDMLVSGTTILGGEERGLPHPVIMDSFYKGTNLTALSVPGTLISDGKLDPGESVALQQIIEHYDTCGSGFEVGISMALLARAVCAALGIPTGGTACTVAIAFAAAFAASLEYEPPNVYIDGGLKNHGNSEGIGYNVPEYVYMRISRYKYEKPPGWQCFWCSPCTYDAPAGLYFRLV
jgi:hypothetical protein